MEKNRLRLRYQELHVVKEWDGDLEGFTAIQLREQAKTLPILDSTMRFIEHLRDYREKLAEAAVRRYEATEQWMECPKCEAEVPTSNGIHCPMAGELGDTGWLGSPPRVPLDGKKAHHLPDPNEEQAEAVARVMGMRPGQMYLIQGPPGTGKTTAIVESIRRILGRNPNASILMSSHSNDAVDTGQERLLGFSHVRQARIAEPGKVPR